jgi:hypothetical protein
VGSRLPARGEARFSMTRQEARVIAEQLCTRIMRMVGLQRCTVPQIAFLADELVRLDERARDAARLQLWKGPDFELWMTMVTGNEHAGWANLVLDRRGNRRMIAALPPPIAAALKEHFPVRKTDGSPG